MNPSRFKMRLGFPVKILALMVSVMVVLFGVAMWVVNHRISAQLHEQAVRELDISREIFLSNQKNIAANLLAQYRHVVGEPRFPALTQDTDFKTSRNFLTNAMRNLIDADGVVVATFTVFRDGSQEIAPVSLYSELDVSDFERQSAVAIARAAAGQAQVDTVCLGVRLYNVIALPVRIGDQATGGTAAGRPDLRRRGSP